MALGRASRVASLSKKIAQKIKLKNTWDIEISALLSQIGCLTIPDEILEKAYKGKELNLEEQKMFFKHPEIGSNLIKNIPRLEGVAAIIVSQLKDPKLLDFIEDEKIRLGSKLLILTIDYDKYLFETNNNYTLAITKIINKEKNNIHETYLVDALKTVVFEELEHKIKLITLKELTENMYFSKDVVTEEGKLLIAKGQKVTESHIIRLKNIANNLKIKEPFEVMIP